MKSLEDTVSPTGARHALTFERAEDRAEFHGSIPAAEQDRVKMMHDAMMRIAAAKNANQGCKWAAKHLRTGLSAKRLRALFDKWADASRDWRALVNRRDYPEAGEAPLPEDFQAHIREKYSANQRKCRPAYDGIIRQWKRWLVGDARQAIPGYAVCPLPGKRGRYPDGWSYKNLMRFAPPPAELTMARIGVHAAMALLPHIPGTREGVRFLEWVSGDDVWLDRQCFVPGYGPLRVVQFGMMDYGASYYLEGFTQRPMIPRPDGTVETLKRRDFLWTLAMMLERYGYPMDYKMHILCERGTATMTRAEAQFLHEVSEGQIIVGYSGMEGKMVHAWEEKKTGNSRAKSWHESFHNLFHNECGDLAGQVGKDRDHSPAALPDREKHALALNEVALILTPEQRARMRMPFQDRHECMRQTVERVEWCNTRERHECEGFQTVMDWRPNGLRILPRPEGELPAWLAANPRATIDDVEFFPRPESPRERMHRLSAGQRFQRLPDSVWQRFYLDNHETGVVSVDGSFSFTREKRAFRFVPPTADQALAPGSKVTGFYRPDGSAIHLFRPETGSPDGAGRYLLTWPAEKRPRRDDTEGKQIAFARKRSFLSKALSETRANMAPEIEQATADARHNLAILAEAGLIETGDGCGAAGEHTLAVVQEGCTATASAVQGLTRVMATEAQQAAAVRKVDVVKETLKRTPKEPPRPENDWL
jgi:hypothetical protein